MASLGISFLLLALLLLVVDGNDEALRRRRQRREGLVANYEIDPFIHDDLEQILAHEHVLASGLVVRDKRQTGELGVSELPSISFRQMASLVSEASEAIAARFEVLEPSLYNNLSARQTPRSPEWFQSASSKIRIAAKNNISRLALIAEEATRYVAERYNLSARAITFALPLADVRGTKELGDQTCAIKVDYPCQPGKYRAYNGYCNNVQNPNWGVANRRYLRYIQSEYSDGISVPRLSSNGGFLPSARVVSLNVHQSGNANKAKHSHLVALAPVWAQFVLHDVSHTPQMAGHLGQRLKCCNVDFELFHPECYPIKMPKDDPLFSQAGVGCQEYSRSASAARTGCTLGPREQINQVTSFIDGSTIYGSSKEEAERLRSFHLGQLKVQLNSINEQLLPADLNGLDCHESEDKRHCFIAGDVRVNEHVGLAALHTVWVRQHNRLALQLSQLNGHWNDEQIFQETRRLIGAQIQHITFNEFLPLILGKETMDKFQLSTKSMGFSSDYDINTNPGTANSVATAAFRFLVSLLPSVLHFSDVSQNRVDTIDLTHSAYRPFGLYEANRVNEIVHALTKNAALDQSAFVERAFTSRLFANGTNGLGIDLIAQIIQQGRDHGLPGYRYWRRFCGLSEPTSFDSLTSLMAPESVERLRRTYVSIDDVDLFSGGLAEIATQGSVVGATFACLIGRQMYYYKSGDRYWYENDIPPSSLSAEQLHEIRKVDLRSVLCDNLGPTIDFLQPEVFIQADPFLNALMPCDNGFSRRSDDDNGLSDESREERAFSLRPWATASPRFVVPDRMLLEAIERGKRDVGEVQEMEFQLYSKGHIADPKSAAGASYAFLKPKAQSDEVANASLILQFASRHFLDNLLVNVHDADKRKRREKRQLKDAEHTLASGGSNSLQELMDVLPNIDVSDAMEIPTVFQCDEQTLPCDHTTKYRTLTGWCNNLKFPQYGKSIRAFTRLLAPAYDDGLMSARQTSVLGGLLPSARLVSVNIHNDVSAPHVRYSLMMMQYGQFIDHDLTHTPVNRGFADSILDCKTCTAHNTVHPECLPIVVPDGDPFYPHRRSGSDFCLAFTRSMPGQLTLGFREQMNQITSFADASNVYGSDLCEMKELRAFQGGRLNVSEQLGSARNMLPVTTENAECKAKSGLCFEAGDARNSEQPMLAVLHTLFVRLHNALANDLSRMNPQWSDETVYQEARRIGIAIQQHITYNEWLPRVLGWNAINLYDLKLVTEGYFHGYDDKCNPTILNEFATAAFRFGHSLLKPSFKRMDDKFREKRGQELKLAKMFFNPDKLRERGMMDDLVRGVASTPMETLDQFITEEVTNHLFEDEHEPFSGLDLAALNIQRGRDHGLPGYNSYRSICNLTRASDFNDLRREVALPVIERLRRTYKHVDDIDLFTGGLSETPLHGGLVGPTFACIIGIQFRNLRKCDRFWYEGGNPLTRFTAQQLSELRKVTLAKVLCETSNNMRALQRAIFDVPDPFLNPRVNCDALPSIDLSLWKERLTCHVNEHNIDKGKARRVSPCVMCTCTKEGPLCQSLKIENCFHLAQAFSPKDILADHVCKVQCAFAFRAFPSVRTGGSKIGFT